MRVLHSDGVLLKSTAQFSMYDPEGNVVFPGGGETVRARYTDWAKAQPYIVLVEEAKPAAPAPKKP